MFDDLYQMIVGSATTDIEIIFHMFLFALFMDLFIGLFKSLCHIGE